jgi:membrane associated rhomboid family serine protease
MRQTSPGLHWSATIVLLVINVIVFLLQLTILPRFVPDNYIWLSLEGLRQGYVWQLITYQFLHGGWSHLIFNMLGLFFFGRPAEAAVGKFRFVQLYLVSGIIGALFQMALAASLPLQFGGWVVGASASVAGLVGAFAILNWTDRFTLLIYFFPVTMRGKTLFWVSVGLALFGMFSRGSHIAHAAHLGGLLAGTAFVKWGLGFRQVPWSWHPFQTHQRKRELVKAASIKTRPWTLSKSDQTNEPPEEEFISREVDPILDKISEYGIQSLTDRERRILEAARNRMKKK